MRFDEHDDRDPKVREYIDFARSSDPEIADVADARRILASAVKAIQRMNHTFSGCDWCDQCGGGNIAMGEAQDEAKQAIEYIEAAGETYTLSCACHNCWHYDATHVRVEAGEFGWGIPVCDKCADLEDHKASRRGELEANSDCGVWYVSEARTSSCTS
jgi:hypothetical protein